MQLKLCITQAGMRSFTEQIMKESFRKIGLCTLDYRFVKEVEERREESLRQDQNTANSVEVDLQLVRDILSACISRKYGWEIEGLISDILRREAQAVKTIDRFNEETSAFIQNAPIEDRSRVSLRCDQAVVYPTHGQIIKGRRKKDKDHGDLEKEK